MWKWVKQSYFGFLSFQAKAKLMIFFFSAQGSEDKIINMVISWPSSSDLIMVLVSFLSCRKYFTRLLVIEVITFKFFLYLNQIYILSTEKTFISRFSLVTQVSPVSGKAIGI